MFDLAVDYTGLDFMTPEVFFAQQRFRAHAHAHRP
jgi:hypothetical protein